MTISDSTHFWLNGSFFSDDDRHIRKEEVKTYRQPALHKSDKTLHKVQNFWEKIFFVTKITS
jgi:hypothetical protein